MNARLARAPVPGPAQTLPDPGERLLHGMALKSGRMLGAEEVLRPGCSATRVAAVGVAGECLGRGRMERNESGLAELGLADDEDAVDEVDVVGREAAGLGEPQAGRDQQGEVRDIGGGPQPVFGPQAACLLQQRSYFRLGVDVRRRSAWDAAQEPDRRDLGRWIEDRAVSRELSHGREPAYGLGRIARSGGLRPLDRELNRHGAVVTDPVGVVGEVPQLPLGRFKVETQSAAHPQVVVDQTMEARGRHRSTSGQGRATSRSLGRSSLA